MRHAEALVAVGRATDALKLLGEAVEQIDAGPQTQFRPIALVVRGDAHRALGDDAAAEDDYMAAASDAATHGATGEELHALARLAQLLGGQGRGAEVHDRLGVVLTAVAGEDSPDVTDAKRLYRAVEALKSQGR